MHKRNPWQEAIIASALLLSILPTLPATAQQVRLPRAKTPVTLLGFESPDAAGNWTGMKTETTTLHVSEGRSALAISFPKWDGKGETWLSSTVAFNGGKGFEVKDWSHYGKLSFDAWVEGNSPLDIAIQLQSSDKKTSWNKELQAVPGKKNTYELSLQDASAMIDMSDVQTITIYGIRAKEDTKLTLDNFRLLPGDKPAFASFDLVYPNYRETIMPGVSNIKTTIDLQLGEYDIDPAHLSLTLTAIDGKYKTSNKVGITGELTTITVPTEKLPVGKVNLSAVLSDKQSGKVIAEKSWSLQKISKDEQAKLRVYIDENNNTIADGKPFFPIGWYGNASLDQLAEIADSPFNTMLPYGVDMHSKAYMRKYLDLVQGYGMKLVYCMNDIYPTATYFDNDNWEGVTGNENIGHAVVNAYKDHPAILAWYLNDERPKELVPKFEGYYKRVRTDDPTRPTYIVIYQMPEVKYFPTTTDIMGVDRYPVPMDPITTVTKEMNISNAAVKGHKPTWAVMQAFGWYQYNDAFPDRGRIPNQEDLRNGRAPSYDEIRNMTYQALVHGAKGLLYYCYYDTRVLPQYAEMWAGLKKIAGEVKTISPILLAPHDLGSVSCDPKDSGVDTMLKELDGQLFLIAVNTKETPCKVTYDLKQLVGDRISVMFEGRYNFNINGTKLTDNFKPLEAHVYDLGKYKK